MTINDQFVLIVSLIRDVIGGFDVAFDSVPAIVEQKRDVVDIPIYEFF